MSSLINPVNPLPGAGTATPTPPPTFLPLIAANLPLHDLAPYPHCVTWNLEWRDGKIGKPGCWTKVLKDPCTGRNAKSNDPTTWGTASDVLNRSVRLL